MRKYDIGEFSLKKNVSLLGTESKYLKGCAFIGDRVKQYPVLTSKLYSSVCIYLQLSRYGQEDACSIFIRFCTLCTKYN